MRQLRWKKESETTFLNFPIYCIHAGGFNFDQYFIFCRCRHWQLHMLQNLIKFYRLVSKHKNFPWAAAHFHNSQSDFGDIGCSTLRAETLPPKAEYCTACIVLAISLFLFEQDFFFFFFFFFSFLFSELGGTWQWLLEPKRPSPCSLVGNLQESRLSIFGLPFDM